MTGPDEGKSRILVAVDGTTSSLRAGAYAAGLARGRNARIICLYVHAPPTVAMPAVANLDDADREFKEQIAMELRNLLAERAGPLGIDVEFIERTGTPFAEIVHVAKELSVDTIVVGASEKVGHRVIGAIGARLIRYGMWPVTVVP